MIALGSDNLLQANSLYDSVTQTFVTNATVTATVLDANTGATLATVSLTGGTGGDYSGTLSASQTSSLVAGTTYILRVVAVVPSGPQLTDQQLHQALYVSS